MSNAKQFMDSLVQGLTGKVDPAEIEIIKDNFKKKYGSAVQSTNEALNTPRTSTAPQSTEQYQAIRNIDTAANADDFVNYRNKGDYLLDSRGTKLNQNSDYQQRATDTHTDAALRLLGGSQREIIGDGYASKAATLAGQTDYKRSFDDKYFGAIKEMQAAEQAQANRGFIKDLALTAATLFMD